jgi:hypothetical protein
MEVYTRACNPNYMFRMVTPKVKDHTDSASIYTQLPHHSGTTSVYGTAFDLKYDTYSVCTIPTVYFFPNGQSVGQRR